MPYSNDNSLLADGAGNAKKAVPQPHSQSQSPQALHPQVVQQQQGQQPQHLVDLLSTPPLLARVTTNDSAHSSASSVSLVSLGRSDSGSAIQSLPMVQPTPSQGLHAVHAQKWQHTRLSQLVQPSKLISIPPTLPVEQAFDTLVKHHLSSLPVQQPGQDPTNFSTFDYNDLNFYLLLALGRIPIPEGNTELADLAKRCQGDGVSDNTEVPVGDLVHVTPKDPFFKLAETESLSNSIRILASGVHRIAITDVQATQVRGILSQRRLVHYLWENARCFADLEPLLNSTIRDLNIGVINATGSSTTSTILANAATSNSRVISVRGDQPLIDALLKMYNECISSIAVVDMQYNLLGNISVTDVKHVTRTSQFHLLNDSCRHFISVILNLRGLENGGKDSFPIFHVYPTSTLGRTIAKLVATQSHRLWIVQRPVGSAPPVPATDVQGHIHNSQDKDNIPGRLIGVVSLTDVLTALARNQTHHKLIDPQFARKHRSPQ